MMNGCAIMKCKYWDGKTCISKRNICLYQTETKELEQVFNLSNNCIGCGSPIDHDYCDRCRKTMGMSLTDSNKNIILTEKDTTMKTKKHHLIPCQSGRRGINGHSAFYCSVNDIIITSNNDILGDKWYMTDGEQADTIWYPSPIAAAIAYFEQGGKAVNETARRYD